MGTARAQLSSARPTTGPVRAGTPVERLLRGGLLAFGALHLAIAVLGLTIPVVFHETMADFGPRNDWLVRDVSLLYGVTGAGMLAAVGRPSWRAPVLTVAVVHYAGHTFSHAVDADRAQPAWVGPVDVAVIGAGTLALAAVLVLALGGERRTDA